MHYVSSFQAAHIDRKVRHYSMWQATVYGIKTFLVALGFGVTVFLVASAPSQLERLSYWFEIIYRSTAQLFSDEVGATPSLSPSMFLDQTRVSDGAVTAPRFESNHLLIPSIDVHAPIIWDIPLADALNGLQRGVVQAHESVGPRDHGRTFIVGHSSGYWWNKNPWTKVFALLDHLKPGDLIFLKDGETTYGYKVTSSEVVSPNEVSVVRDDSLDHNQLVLMTCTPVGTTLNRLVVYAKPVPLK